MFNGGNLAGWIIGLAVLYVCYRWAVTLHYSKESDNA